MVTLLSAALLPVYLGYHQVIIYGGSMGAALPVGSVAVTKTIDAADVRVGDVIAVRGGAAGPPVIHRVVEIEPISAGRRVVTRGDANVDADPTSRVLQGRGDRVVFVIPMLGYLVHHSRTMPGVAILAATILIALASTAVRDLRRKTAGLGGRLAPPSGGVAGQRWLLARRAAARRHRAAALLLAGTLLASPGLAPVADAAFMDAAAVGANLFSADTMDAPTGVTAIGAGSTITIAWSVVPDTYAVGYRVFRATAPGGPYAQVNQVTPRATTSYTDSPGSGTFYYVVRSFAQNWESSASAEVSATAGISGVTFDQSSHTTGNRVSNLSWTHTVSTGFTNRLLLIAISTDANHPATAVTYGGAPLTFFGGQTDGNLKARVEIWYRVNPTAGAAGVVVSFGSQTDDDVVAGATSWGNVHQVVPLGTGAFGTAKTGVASAVVTSAAGEYVFDVASGNQSTLTASGQTQLWSERVDKVGGGGGRKAGAPSVTVSWLLPAEWWAIAAVPIKPAGP